RHLRCRLRRLPSDSLGRIDGALTACAPRAGLPVSRNDALLDPGGMGEVCVARKKNGRAGGRFLHTWCLAS
ncbi:hypothetical protein, partial [Achromobacter xylosoxidans]|uniref:hypothetical protein n=1 Tax=Alcaligenes xylosoxydans xylosoxydans TaxID=85698 RepID=UPI001F12C469